MMTVVTEVTLGAGRGVTSGCSGEVRQRRGRVRDRGERTQRCPCLGTRHGAAIPRRWRRAVAAFGCPPRSAPHRDRSGPARVEGSGDVRPPHDRVDRGVASPEWVEALRIDDLQSSGCHTFSQSSRRFGPGIPSTRHGRRYTCFAGWAFLPKANRSPASRLLKTRLSSTVVGQSAGISGTRPGVAIESLPLAGRVIIDPRTGRPCSQISNITQLR
jgi:hypothetical protein